MHAKLRSALSCLDGADGIVLQSIVGEELAQGPYMTARVGFEPSTFFKTIATSERCGSVSITIDMK